MTRSKPKPCPACGADPVVWGSCVNTEWPCECVMVGEVGENDQTPTIPVEFNEVEES